MTAKKLEDLNVAKTNRVVVNERERKKRMFSARYFFSLYQNVQYSLFVDLIVSECLELALCYSHRIMSKHTRSLQHICSFGEDRIDTRNQSQSLYPHVLGPDQ